MFPFVGFSSLITFGVRDYKFSLMHSNNAFIKIVNKIHKEINPRGLLY